MRNSRQGPIPADGDLGDLIDELDDIARRLHTLEAPSGEALGSTVAKLTALVNDIQAELDNYMAGRYTNANIDAKDAAVQSQINPSIAAVLAGNVTVAGAFFNPPAYSTDITGTRRAAWVQIDGRLGYASSDARKKTAVRPVDSEALAALLDVEPKSFIYRAEIRARTSRRINDGVDYRPARELGLMAQDLDAAGLGFFVYHDEDGEPEGVEYGMLTVALLAIARGQRDELDGIRRRLELLESDR